MNINLQKILSSGLSFSAEERVLKNKYKYLNIMLIFAFIFVPPSIIIGYFLEGPELTTVHVTTFFLLFYSFFALRKGKKYYVKAVWAYVLTPTIMISFALFMSENNYTRVILPLFPVVVTYLFLDKRAGMLMALYSLLLITATLLVDIGLQPKDWISTILLIILIIFIFNFYHDMHEEDKAILSQTNKALQKLTVTDALTQVKNRHGLDKILADEVKRFERFERPFGIIMVDIDFFKEVNDTYGHQIGDTVLQKIAQLLQDSVRETDIVGRWGGEEFLIICPETALKETLFIAESIRNKIALYTFASIGKITVSLGADIIHKGEKCQSLIKKVDCFLYKAKESGRNRVCGNPQK